MSLDFVAIFNVNVKDINFELKSLASVKSSENGIFIDNQTEYFIRDLDQKTTIFIGDYISRFEVKSNDAKEILTQKGNFYVIQYDLLTNSYFFFSSFFSLLPIYYYQSNICTIISSNIELIRSIVGKNSLSINRKFLLEKALFNYAFSNATFFNEVNLLPTHSFYKYDSRGCSINKIFEISDLFPRTLHNADSFNLEQLTQHFINQTQQYFIDDCTINFTAGFDGRTLISIANYFEIPFKAYSLGLFSNPDVHIPCAQSKALGFDYSWLNLDSESYRKSFFKFATEVTFKSTANYNISNTHFYVGAKQVSKMSKYLLTGYMGSELFRAIHNTGAVTTQELVSFFSEKGNKWKDILQNSQKLDFLNRSNLNIDLEMLIAEMEQYKNGLSTMSNVNHEFYNFVFEEVFRKYFGTLIKQQFNFLNIRTPYIDYDFITKLFYSKYAGINNSFFTHNKLKRFKGQLLYASVIKKTNATLSKMPTGKGYAPIDLLTFQGKLKILKTSALKQFRKKYEVNLIDPYRIFAGLSTIETPDFNKTFFNVSNCSNNLQNIHSLNSETRSLIYVLTTLNIYCNKFTNE